MATDWTFARRGHRARRIDPATLPELATLGGLVHRACPLCGADAPRAIFRELATPPLQSWYTRDVFTVADCGRCGLSYTVDIPSPEWFERYHSPEHNPELRNTGAAAIDTYEHSSRFARPYYLAGLRLLRRARVPAGTRILDVGCSEGYFVELARRRGYDAIGVDPVGSAVRSAQARGLPVYCGTAADVPVGPASLGAATMFDTIEHFAEPAEVLGQVHRLLRPGGKLVLTTPNFLDGLQRIRRSRGFGEPALFEYWGGSLHAWDHVNFYTPARLDRQLSSAGFRVLKRVRRPIGSGLSYRSRLSSYGRLAQYYLSGGLIDRSVYQVVLAEKPSVARAEHN